MPNVNIYLDQNIIGYQVDGTLDLSKIFDKLAKSPDIISEISGVTWIYSEEHFREISRSDDPSPFLDALKKIKAQEIKLSLNENFQITDGAYIDTYSCPHERYERFTSANSEVEFDETGSIALIARMFGADNYANVQSSPEKFISQIKKLLEPIDKWDEKTAGEVQDIAADLDAMIRDDLSEKRSLETNRKLLGTEKGKAGNAKSDNPIAEIWEMMPAEAKVITPDQFFGFDPIDKQGFDTWPMYLGIISCYLILSFIGFRPDKKFPSEHALPNIMSDAVHVAHGAYCHLLMSGDKRLCSKARAIYKFKKIGTLMAELEITKCDPQPASA